MQTYQNQRKSERRSRLCRGLGIQLLVYALLIFSAPAVLSAAVFHVSAGDVPGLIAAINAANANRQENTIVLEAGTYTLTSIDNSFADGDNGLPVIASTLRIQGESSETTIIERDANAAPFRLFAIGRGIGPGNLTLEAITVKGGRTVDGDDGGALSKLRGTMNITMTIINSAIVNNVASGGGGIFCIGCVVTIINSIISQNSSRHIGGGINVLDCTLNIINSTISDNAAPEAGGGGVSVFESTVNITNTTISGNTAIIGGGIENLDSTVNITNTTISNNTVRPSGGSAATGGGIINSVIGGKGTTITNSTIAGNSAAVGGGIHNEFPGTVSLRNTILARNTAETGPDCFFDTITSLGMGNNLIGDPTNCSITLQPSDLTGDPGLANFLDDGAPGHGRFPLLPGSQVINAGNDAACASTDQLGTPRNGPCDIGAVEFYPVVNDLVAVGNMSTDFDATPVPGGPAGTFRITADLMNTSNQAIVNPFVEVVDLTGGNLLLNANGGAGGVGARLTLPDSASTPFHPGASSTFEFLIGLQQRESFTFFVNMLGEPRTSNPSVSKR